MLVLRRSSESSKLHETLIAACVENLQYDRQCEDRRATYLMRLAVAANLETRVLEAILDALPAAENDWDIGQMVHLLGLYVSRGESRAWDTLVARAQNQDERAQDVLAESGEEGLSWVERNVLPSLPKADRYRIMFWLPEEADDDRTATQQRLREVYNAYEAERSVPTKQFTDPVFTPREYLDRLGDGNVFRLSARRFADEASHEEFEEAARRFLSSDDRKVLRELRFAFRKRPFPRPERLFDLVEDEMKGVLACQVLGFIDDPLVRHRGLELLRKRPFPEYALDVLRGSFKPGDEPLLWELLNHIATLDTFDYHDVVLDLIQMTDHLAGIDWQPFMEWVYEHSPCSFCRASSVRWMVEKGSVPPQVREEAPFDAESDIRDLL